MRFVTAVPMLAAAARAGKGARALRAPRARMAPRAAPRAALQPRQILGLAALATAAPLAALATAAPLAALGPAGALAALATAAPFAALAQAPPRAPPRAARPFSAAAGCALHGLPCCPGCDPRAYTVGRVTRAVEFGLKRLKIRKAGSVLRCLGARSWDEVRQRAARARGGARRSAAERGGARRSARCGAGVDTDRCWPRRCTRTSSASARTGIGCTPTRR
jgi:hypothetical protein